ncbi:MAG: glycosyltransferase family 4 protein [Candidatus Omnitrophica bacterium]|nr:glycosyltransferase family 4 protein [Candidatus Omnitrophota bacterium]
MKILQLSTHLDRGGITSYVLNLSQGLRDLGHECALFTGGGTHEIRLKELGLAHVRGMVPTSSELNPRLIPATYRLVRLIRREKIEILHAHSRVTQVLCTLAGGLTRVPWVSTCHGVYRNHWGRRVLPAWGRRTVAISKVVGDWLIREMGVPEAQVRRVNTGLDAAQWRPSSSAEPSLKERCGWQNSLLIGSVGRLSEEKGHTVLVEAFAQVAAKNPLARLLLVGDGRLRPVLEQRIGAFGLQGIVRIEPALDLPAHLHELDLFVLPTSGIEGLGIAVLEAMAASVPVVATRSGGPEELIEHGRTGWLVERGKHAAMAGLVLDLLNDERRRVSTVEPALEFVKREHSIENMARSTAEIYQELV